MKKIRIALACAAAVLAAWCEIVDVEIRAGANSVPGPARVVAVQAVSTNASSTAVLFKVTPVELEWFDEAVVTNYTYRPASSNVQYTATETLWSAWSTNSYSVVTGSVVGVAMVTNVSTVVTGTVYSASTGFSNLTHTVTNVTAVTNTVPLVSTGVVSNLLAQAWGAKPTVAGWSTNVLLYTSQSLSRALSSNVTYQVVDTVDVRTERTRRVSHHEVSNTLWSATLSGGFKTNRLDAAIFSGDFLFGAGTVFTGGKVRLLLEK